ncbi:MAG TPA: penicillin-binding protein activator [Pseudomonadales bacterium]|nr:penicillin-binding protein activator [Pseudomonadales bacterium]
MNRAHHLVCTACLTILLSSCGGTPQKPDVIASPVNLPAEDALTLMLQRAQNAQGERASSLRLEAAELALEEQKWPLLRALLEQIDSRDLLADGVIRFALVSSALSQHDNNNQAALTALNQDIVSQASRRVNPALTSRYLWQMAELQAKLGYVSAAIEQLIKREGFISPTEQANNQQQLWRFLLLLSQPELDALLGSTSDTTLRGWLELASLYRDANADVTLQAKTLEAWQRRWPDHNANKTLPSGLQRLQAAANNLPQKVLICLPTSGQLAVVGQTIRDGILYAYWKQRQAGLPTPQLVFIDSQPLDSDAIVAKIIASEADVVIGPFNKDKVAEVAARAAELPNTLLLNVLNDQSLADNLISFGLNPEDEAAQIADRALIESGTRALVISPNNSLGDRLQSAFVDRWLDLGGTVSQSGRYEDGKDISNTIKTALNIDKSEMRKRRLALNTGLTLQFEPRRRADIDMAAVFGKPQDARSISPIFAFHYAEDIPLYSSSMVFTGETDTTADRDLEGVKFNDIPWLFNPDSTEQALSGIRFKRLFAMGMDAYRLHQRFELLDPMVGMQLQGTTGLLQLNEQRQIVRQLEWASFINGMAKPLPAIQ